MPNLAQHDIYVITCHSKLILESFPDFRTLK